MSMDTIIMEDGSEEKCNLETGEFERVLDKKLEAYILSHNPKAGSFCFPLKKGPNGFTSQEEWRERWINLGEPIFRLSYFSITLDEMMSLVPVDTEVKSCKGRRGRRKGRRKGRRMGRRMGRKGRKGRNEDKNYNIRHNVTGEIGMICSKCRKKKDNGIGHGKDFICIDCIGENKNG